MSATTQSVSSAPIAKVAPPTILSLEDRRQFLTFSLGQEVFAVGILAIKEILRYGTITEVPMTHPCLVGVINLRGRVVPIIDLAVRLGREPVNIGRRTCVVITEVGTESGMLEMGLVVDVVRAVVDIPSAAVEPPPAFGIRLHSDYILGVTRQDDVFVVLLDLARILALDELSILGQGSNSLH